MLIQIIILTLTFPKIDLGACLEFFYHQTILKRSKRFGRICKVTRLNHTISHSPISPQTIYKTLLFMSVATMFGSWKSVVEISRNYKQPI
jgi:hypothetical protein